MEWVVYILQCRDGSYYTGITKDMTRRLRQHNREINGGAKYTAGRGPCTLILHTRLMEHGDAARLECAIKKLKRADKIPHLTKFAEEK